VVIGLPSTRQLSYGNEDAHKPSKLAFPAEVMVWTAIRRRSRCSREYAQRHGEGMAVLAGRDLGRLRACRGRPRAGFGGIWRELAGSGLVFGGRVSRPSGVGFR